MSRIGKTKTSIQFKLIKGLFRTIGVNRMLDKQGKEFDRLLLHYAKKQEKELPIPKKVANNFIVEKKQIDQTVYYIVRQREMIPKKAILYCFGGGYIMPPDSGDLVLCGQISENCCAEVWFPVYPMAPRYRLIETVTVCCKIYEKMLESYPADRIRFFGTSSGGGLALSICEYIVHEQMSLPLPGKLVLQSPGLQVPPSKDQKIRMAQLRKRDIMIPPRFFDNIAPVLATGDEAYLLSPILFNLSGFPPIDLFYGTEEVMIAYLADMEKVCDKYGVKLHIHIGEGMIHCWGAMEFVPEAKQVRQEYFAALD